MSTIQRVRIDRWVWIVLGCVLLFLGGCKGRTTQSSQPPPPPTPAPPSETTKEQRVPMIVKKEAAKKPTTPVPNEEKPISLDPLFGVPVQRIYPRDFELGELKPRDPTAQNAGILVEEFFTRLRQGLSVQELLHPEYRWFLEEDLKRWQGKPIPREIRFGTASESPSGVIEIPFRVLQEGRSVVGSILLEKKEAQWYVIDFFLDWEEKGTKEKESFDPFKE